MIDNIFTALTHEKTTGAILEFILWCTVCSAALLSLIALAMGGGEITWILLMLFSVGLAVLMAFRLKAIALLYSVGVFYLLAFFIHYFRFSFGYSYGASHSPINILLFVLTLMLSLAIVICAFIHFFSNAFRSRADDSGTVRLGSYFPAAGADVCIGIHRRNFIYKQ